ncbi:MAG: hypothetical protein ACOZBL_05035 [Patescibacteria group bacterium]
MDRSEEFFEISFTKKRLNQEAKTHKILKILTKLSNSANSFIDKNLNAKG